jgi:hypothetical protein
VKRLLLAVLVVSAALLAPAVSDAYVVAGTPWPAGRVAYHVDVPALRTAVEAAAARWNRSGAKIHLVEVPAAQAAIRVRRLAEGPCDGIVGNAPVGREGSGVGIVELQASCGPKGLIPVAAHELGHVLGFGHETKLCSIMSPEEGNRAVQCGGLAPLPWEYDCRVLEPTDIAGAVKLYGGRAKAPRAGFPYCPTLPTPPPATKARAFAFPASSLATTSVSWNAAASPSFKHVLVNRRAGTCPTYPSVPGVHSTPIRPGSPTRIGITVAYRVGRSGTQSALDVDSLDPGHWCYAVWTLGPSNRYTRAATAGVQIGPRPALATSLGLSATATLVPSVIVVGGSTPQVALHFTLPATPAVTAIRVERIAGTCPAPGTTVLGALVGEPAPTPGQITVTDSADLSPGAWCYAVDIQLADRDLDPALVQVEVPAATTPPVVPVVVPSG